MPPCEICSWPETTWRGLCKVHEWMAAARRAETAGLPHLADRFRDLATALYAARQEARYL